MPLLILQKEKKFKLQCPAPAADFVRTCETIHSKQS